MGDSFSKRNAKRDTLDSARQHALEQIEQCHKLLDAQATFTELVGSLKDACKAVIGASSRQVLAATLNDSNAKLWAAHSALNRRFRDAFNTQHAAQKKNTSRLFLVFIKSSQDFYRRCVHSLGQHHGTQELMTPTSNPLVEGDELASHGVVAKDYSNSITRLCYDALISLGDLSRWREQLLPQEPPDWKPARGYYYLASSIRPEWSLHHNQIALTYTAEGDHFNALYHLYRFRAVQPCDVCVEGNLRMEMVKISSANKRNDVERRMSRHSNEDGSVLLTPAFLLVHCAISSRKKLDQAIFAVEKKFYNLVQSLLRSDESENTCNIIARRMAIMNIAAEQWNPLFRHLNISFCTILFDISSEEIKDMQHEKLPEPTYYLLAPLRIYSLWILKNWKSLSAGRMDAERKHVWQSYARFLTMLANCVSIGDLPKANYLLAEDEETRGFSPLMGEHIERAWKIEPRYKLAIHQEKQRLAPEMESLVRIRDLLVDGMSIALEESTPLRLDGTTFVCEALLHS